MPEALTQEEIKQQMVVLRMEKNDVHGNPMQELKAKHHGREITLKPGQNTKQLTREAANHIINRAKNWEVKPIIKIVELRPADEVAPDAPEEVDPELASQEAEDTDEAKGPEQADKKKKGGKK